MCTSLCVYRAFTVAFFGHYMSFPCAPVRSCAFLGVPVCSRVFSIHPNWPMLNIIHLHYGLESAFVVYLPIPCVLNVISSNQPWLYVGYSYKWSLERPIIYFISLQIGILMPYYLISQHICVPGIKNNLHPQFFCLSIVK